MKTQNVLCLLWAGILLSGGFVSCGTEAVEETEPVVTETTAETEEVMPVYNFEGAAFSFLVPAHATEHIYQSQEIAVEELNGNPINDAVYNRNLEIAETHNVRILAENDLDVVTTARGMSMGGDTAFQVYMPYLNSCTALMQEGLFSDLLQYEGLNLDRNWWDQNANSGLKIKDKLYFSTGDISIIDENCTVIMYFNKRLVNDFKMKDPYMLVREKKWTLDEMFVYADVYVDTNGDGEKDNTDLYGLGLTKPVYLCYSGGMTIASKDTDGNTVVDLDTVYNMELISTLTGYFQSGSEGLFWPKWDVARDSFKANTLMLYTSALGNLELYMSSFDDVEFGLLPLPMYDENQDGYHTLVSTIFVPVVTIPQHLDAKTAEDTAIVCDLLARYSTDTLRYQYYDIALHNRYFSDEESGEMLDIIFQSRIYDLGWIYNWGGVTGIFDNMQKGNTFASDYASKKAAIETAMQETITIAEAK